MKYRILAQTRPADAPRDRGYDAKVWRELEDLYQGGYQILEHAKDYIPIQVGEQPERYQERLLLAAYIGYFGSIVDYYASALFGRQIAVVPAEVHHGEALPIDEEVYKLFSANADLKGATFAEVLKRAFVAGLVKGKGLIAVDFPPRDGITVATRADEERLGLSRPYIYDVWPEELIDWEYDDEIRRRADLGRERRVEWEFGKFAWAVLRRCVRVRATPDEQRGDVAEEFKLWRRLANGVVAWQLYRTAPQKDGQKPRPDDEVPLVAEGSTSFVEIPLIEIRLPPNLWIGNVLGPLNLEHWRRRSTLLAGQQKSLYEIPVAYLGSEMTEMGEALPAERAQDPSRGDDPVKRFSRRGYLVMGEKDRLRFEGPSGKAFEVVDKQLSDLVDEMHRVSHRMAASISATSTALGRSGASKQSDLEATAIVLEALGAMVRDAAVRTYDVISDARGEEDVDWSAHGMDDFESNDRAAVLEEAMQLGALAIPSRTALIELQTRTALALLPGLAPETQAVIRQEIADGTPAESLVPPPDREQIEGDAVVEEEGLEGADPAAASEQRAKAAA